MNRNELKSFLDEQVDIYNEKGFIESDPISIPHLFSLKQDIEIAGFLVATIAWGRRDIILRNGKIMMNLLGNSPFDFIMNHKSYHLDRCDNFVHRTFNPTDFRYFIESLRNIYVNHGGLEKVFTDNATEQSILPAITKFKYLFFSHGNPEFRTRKHISDPNNGSCAKRLNMMLRWFCRKDDRGVDFGIWENISPSILSCPLDVHSGNIARELGLITRKTNDIKALIELDENLRKLDAMDPVKYDFALFGIGVNQKMYS